MAPLGLTRGKSPAPWVTTQNFLFLLHEVEAMSKLSLKHNMKQFFFKKIGCVNFNFLFPETAGFIENKHPVLSA